MRAVRRGDRVALTIGPGSSGAASPRAGRLLPVPPLVDRAAPSGVVPGEPGGAAVLGASSGFAEGAHHRFGAGGAASAIASQHNHAWIVPPPKQGKLFSASPYPSPVGLAVVASGRLPPAGSSSHVVLVAVVGLGWLGVARRLSPTGPTHGRRPDRAGPARPAQIGAQVAGCRVPRARAARPSIPAREVAWTRGSCLPGWAAVVSA
jgi:hypothetical protein